MEERQYDLIFICRPDTPEPDIDKIIATVEHAAADKGGKIESVNKWGRKRMAYRVQKLREGYYVYMVLKSTHGEVIKELERLIINSQHGSLASPSGGYPYRTNLGAVPEKSLSVL